MISSFLKKLIFARQFFIIDGRIEILGKKQVMLPSDIVAEVARLNSPRAYSAVKKVVVADVGDYARKLGSGEEGMLRNIDHIFETFGLGRLEIVDMDYKNKRCVVRLHNSPLPNGAASDGYHLTPAVISGVFSFLFSKDVEAKQSKAAKGTGYREYVLE